MIAPHVNNEVRLVLAGSKPLATIERNKDLTGFCMAVQLMGAGMLAGEVHPTQDCEAGEVAFTLPKNRGVLNSYHWLLKHGVAELGIKGYHRNMGALFGYTPADIEEFIEAEIKCDCVKCKGMKV